LSIRRGTKAMWLTGRRRSGRSCGGRRGNNSEFKG
jgi:hypothetical protein